MKRIGHCALPALFALLSACKPPAEVPSPRGQPLVSAMPEDAHAARAGDAERALDLLAARLQRDKVYADDCSVFELEDDANDENGAFDIAVRERHGAGCPGDPQTSPVRDRFQVARGGAIRWYDPAEGAFVDYAERAKRSD